MPVEHKNQRKPEWDITRHDYFVCILLLQFLTARIRQRRAKVDWHYQRKQALGNRTEKSSTSNVFELIVTRTRDFPNPTLLTEML